MSKIAIKSIEVEAFKAFAAPSVFDLSTLPSGLHRVRGINRTNNRLGSNGAGKSTFFSDAPTWCLYGRTVGGLRTTDVKSWLATAAPRVAVVVQREKEALTIQRGPRASDLTINGRAVGQADVDAAIGLSADAWAQAVVLGQGMPLFFDLSASDKMALLSDALGLDRWDRRAEAASARARRMEARAATLAGELTSLQGVLQRLEGALRAAKEAADGWAHAHASQIARAAAELGATRARAGALDERRGAASLAVDAAGMAVRLLRPDVDTARARIADQQAIARDSSTEVRRIRDRLADVLRQLEAFDAPTARCPTCGQPVAKRDAAKHARPLREQARALETEIETKEAEGRHAQRAVEEMRDALMGDVERLHDLDAQEARANGELRLIEREHAAAFERCTAAEDSLRRIEREENPHREAAARARRELGETKAIRKETEARLARIAVAVERAQFWARGFRDIRLGIIDEVLDDLRETIAEVLEGLGLGEWGVDLTTERETKSGTTQRALAVIIRSPAAPETGVRWEAYSGGERQRLRLAGALALSEVLLAHAGVEFDYRVLDEPTRGLSPEGVRDLVEVLGEYASTAGLRVLYVDHQSEDGLTFASTVTIENGAEGASVTMPR